MITPANLKTSSPSHGQVPPERPLKKTQQVAIHALDPLKEKFNTWLAQEKTGPFVLLGEKGSGKKALAKDLAESSGKKVIWLTAENLSELAKQCQEQWLQIHREEKSPMPEAIFMDIRSWFDKDLRKQDLLDDALKFGDWLAHQDDSLLVLHKASPKLTRFLSNRSNVLITSDSPSPSWGENDYFVKKSYGELAPLTSILNLTEQENQDLFNALNYNPYYTQLAVDFLAKLHLPLAKFLEVFSAAQPPFKSNFILHQTVPRTFYNILKEQNHPLLLPLTYLAYLDPQNPPLSFLAQWCNVSEEELAAFTPFISQDHLRSEASASMRRDDTDQYQHFCDLVSFYKYLKERYFGTYLSSMGRHCSKEWYADHPEEDKWLHSEAQRRCASFSDPLSRAIFTGKIQKVEKILSSSKAPLLNQGSKTFLMLAAQEGQAEIVELLLKHGSEINATDQNQLTALVYAVASGSVRTVQCFLDHGAQIDQLTEKKQTPVHIAAKYGHVRVLKLLLERGVDPDAKCDQGFNAHVYAALSNNPRMFAALKELGIEISEEDARSALKIATSKKHAVYMSELYQAYPSLPIYQTAATAAFEAGDDALLAQFLTRGIYPNLTQQEKLDVFLAAGTKNLSRSLEIILKYNPDLNTDLNNHETSFTHILKHCNEETALTLLKQNVNINKFINDHTPLMIAASRNFPRAIEEMILEGAEINKTNAQNETSLMQAVKRGSLEAVDKLLRLGANIDIPDSLGLTPIHFAANSGTEEMILLLLPFYQNIEDMKALLNDFFDIRDLHNASAQLIQMGKA